MNTEAVLSIAMLIVIAACAFAFVWLVGRRLGRRHERSTLGLAISTWRRTSPFVARYGCVLLSIRRGKRARLTPDIGPYEIRASRSGDLLRSQVNYEPSLDAIANGIDELVRRMDLDGFTLVGHSMCGHVAWTFSARNPERLSTLVLNSSGGLRPPGHREITLRTGFRAVRRRESGSRR